MPKRLSFEALKARHCSPYLCLYCLAENKAVPAVKLTCQLTRIGQALMSAEAQQSRMAPAKRIADCHIGGNQGQVLTYQGSPSCTYHSTSGGQTQPAADY